MLRDVVGVPDSFIVSSEFNRWSVLGDECNQQVASDLTSCQEKVVLRRKASETQLSANLGSRVLVRHQPVHLLNVVASNFKHRKEGTV